jgi:hydroxylamine reductase
LPGFPADREEKTVMVRFGRNAVPGVAGTVIQAINNKKIRRFLVACCDSAKPGRNYYNTLRFSPLKAKAVA